MRQILGVCVCPQILVNKASGDSVLQVLGNKARKNCQIVPALPMYRGKGQRDNGPKRYERFSEIFRCFPEIFQRFPEILRIRFLIRNGQNRSPSLRYPLYPFPTSVCETSALDSDKIGHLNHESGPAPWTLMHFDCLGFMVAVCRPLTQKMKRSETI